jgi:CSLREA domain-containing protein
LGPHAAGMTPTDMAESTARWPAGRRWRVPLYALCLLTLTISLASVPTAAATEMRFHTPSPADPGDGVCNAECTLREAIHAANTNPGPDRITFGLSGSAPHVISLDPPASGGGPLPAITDPVSIDGRTQRGWSATGGAAPIVQVDGASAGDGSAGLVVQADDTTILGLIVSNFEGDGVRFESGFNGGLFLSLIGTNPAGTSAAPNRGAGVHVLSDANGTTIGGGSWRNLISGNEGNGVSVSGSSGTQILENYIGVDKTGERPLPNGGRGVLAVDASNISVGSGSDGNVISSNGSDGIVIRSTATPGNGGGIVANNAVGVAQRASDPLGNGGDGIRIENSPNMDINNNRVVANHGAGIVLAGAGTTGALLYWNRIGEDSLGNDGDGIRIIGGASDNVVGAPVSTVRQNPGTWDAPGNRICCNGGDGIDVVSGSGNTLRTNLVDRNAGRQIDLGSDGPTPNDSGDTDDGANGLQNAPVVKVYSRGSTQVMGSLDSQPNTMYDIDFFRNTGCEGVSPDRDRYWVGSVVVTTDPQGHASFGLGYWYTPGDRDSLLLGPDEGVTAVATNVSSGDSSELSNCSMPLVAELSLGPTTDADTVRLGESVEYPITVQNAGPDIAENGTFRVQAVGANLRMAEIVSANLDAGSCSPVEESLLECSLGSMDAGQVIHGDIVVRPLAPGEIHVSIWTSSSSVDTVPGDDGVLDMYESVCTVTGTERDDVLRGTSGDDVICGEAGNDVITGAGGNDVILGGAGSDRMTGGDGRDTVSFADAPSGVSVDLGEGESTGFGRDHVIDLENVTGSPWKDRLTGDGRSNVLRGLRGGDRCFGAGGNDLFLERNGRRDELDGGGGLDRGEVDRSLDQRRSVEKLL